MIADEVICGFGRLGRMFGCEAVGLPARTRSRSPRRCRRPICRSPPCWCRSACTRRSSPRAARSARSATASPIPAIRSRPRSRSRRWRSIARERIVDKVAAIVPQFQAALRRLGEHPLVGEARGVGLIGGIELVADKRTRRSFDAKRGVGGPLRRVCAGRGPDRASPRERHRVAVPAAHHLAATT